MADRNFCLQVAAQSFRNLPGNPVLPEGGLNENIQPCKEEEQGEEKPFQYFFKSPQVQPVKL